ncbi:MAG: hypothetical protein ABL886_02725 [Rhodoglobus sp.]
MRWDHLFDDIEAQLERELSAEEQDLVAEEERLRLGRLAVRDRLRALHASSTEPLSITLKTGSRLLMSVEGFGRDWVSVDVIDGPVRRGPCLVPIASITSISLPPGRVAASLDAERDARAEASLALRLGLPFVLRDLCRRRRSVELVTAHATTRGTIDRVGRDHLDLAVHEPGSPRRVGQISEVAVVPLASLVLVLF